ncbi:YihY family inner membrane protein [Marinimicrobium sp. ARAG 43.8]|uniref:YihY family inner membrane protein n=1 Tax=Marinimicrobium sp. ARAG 43.8 TaxID=3418719 RepID=UPI003CF76509
MRDWFTSDNRRRYVRQSTQFVQMMWQRLYDTDCQKSAAQLTYVTLFALVPLMTVTYSMFSTIPAFQGVGDQLQSLIFANMVPESGQELLGHLQNFSRQARRLTIVGAVFLVASAYFMLANIEKNFNVVWGIVKGRRGISKFLLYWAVLSLGPLLLGVGLAMSTYLASLELFMDGYEALGLVTWVFGFAPVLLTSATFTLLFAAVPNCSVPIRHALLGGILTGVSFEVLKAVFGLIVANSALSSIYGAFAIVPLFLLWVNLTWLVILGGAVFVHTLGIYQIALRDRGYPDLVAAILVLWYFYQRSLQGRGLEDGELLELGLASDQWQRIREALQAHHWIAVTNQGDFVLCRDLHHQRIRELVPLLNTPKVLPDPALGLEKLPWYPELYRRLRGVDAFSEEQLGLTFTELFERESEQTMTAQPHAL